MIGVDRSIGMLREASAPLAAMDLTELGSRESVADAALLAWGGAGAPRTHQPIWGDQPP